MAIKTLLVHLAPDEDWENRLKSAVQLTKELKGHLIALYVATPVHMPPGAEGRGASAHYLAEARISAREKADTVLNTAKSLCEDAGISWEWSYGEADHLDHLLDEVHHVDLTVLNQVSFDSFEDRLMFQLPEKLVIGAGGPVLILPKGSSDFKGLTKVGHVMIAWTYSKEAIRALRDSLAILEGAKKVTLLTCGLAPEESQIAAQSVVDYLARHGIQAEHVNARVKGHAGEEILDLADDLKADLVVMGAYGQVSFMDKLFGSASRYVISHTKVPVLMSH